MYASSVRIIIGLLYVVTIITAHNWMGTTARSGLASTLGPCTSRKTSDTHAQIGPGQRFVHANAVGHPHTTGYFAIVAGNNNV